MDGVNMVDPISVTYSRADLDAMAAQQAAQQAAATAAEQAAAAQTAAAAAQTQQRQAAQQAAQPTTAQQIADLQQQIAALQQPSSANETYNAGIARLGAIEAATTKLNQLQSDQFNSTPAYATYQEDPAYARVKQLASMPSEQTYNSPDNMAFLADFSAKYPGFASVYNASTSQNPVGASGTTSQKAAAGDTAAQAAMSSPTWNSGDSGLSAGAGYVGGVYNPLTGETTGGHPSEAAMAADRASSGIVSLVGNTQNLAQSALGSLNNPITSLAQVSDAYAQNRPGYTPLANLGDQNSPLIAAEIMKASQMATLAAGYLNLGGLNVPVGTPFNSYQASALALQGQLSAAQLTPGLRDDQFFANELSKSAENAVERSSEYHYIGKTLGIPVPANPFEYQGDLAVTYLKGMDTRSSFPEVNSIMAATLPSGLGLQDYQWNMAKGIGTPLDFTKATNLLVQSQGEYGPYATLFGGPSYVGTPSSEGLRQQPAFTLTSAIINTLNSKLSLDGYTPASVYDTGSIKDFQKDMTQDITTIGSKGSVTNQYLSPLGMFLKGDTTKEQSSITNPSYGSIQFTSIAPFGQEQPKLNLPGPMGTTITSLGIIGNTKNMTPPEYTRFPPTNNGGILDAVGFGMLGLGTAMAANTEDFFKKVEDFIPSGVLSPVKVGLGFAEVVPQTVSMVPLVGGAAYVFGKDTGWGTSMIIPTATNIGTGMVKRAIEQPERSFGNLLGMDASGEMGGAGLNYAKIVAPAGIDIAEIGASTGARSSILFAYTKPIGAGVEEATIRGFIASNAISEPAKIIGSKAFSLNPTDINFIEGKVPTFSDVSTARTSLGELAGKEGTYLHGIKSNQVPFLQELIERGEVTVGAGSKGTEPMYLSASTDSVLQRFAKTGIIRITGIVESVESALKYEGTAKAPILSEGIYPGIKPITGEAYKGSLQQELIIPAGTKLSVTDISYIVNEGRSLPVVDVTIGKLGIMDRINMAANRFEYGLNSIRMPEYGFGQPTTFLKNADISMSNPMEEVANAQWTPAQKAVLNPYLTTRAGEQAAPLSLKAVVAGQKAVPLFREVNFVQREPVGEVLVGREMSRETIASVFNNRATFGDDLMSGGSTTIKANLGDAFFDKSVIGDIDAWAKADRVAELQKTEIDIIKSDQPSVVSSRLPGLQEGFPVAEVRISGSSKPLTEIHSFEAFPAVKQPSNIGTLKAVGGADVTGPSTGFFGGLRKSSASFDKMTLTQEPGGYPEIALNPKNVKHAVGTSAVAKEAASLFYGRDADITGMEPSYAKGKAMENYANAMDNLLESQKGASAKEIQKYQNTIKINPIELPETKVAKAKAYADRVESEPFLNTKGNLGGEIPEYPVARSSSPSESEPLYPIAGFSIGGDIGATIYPSVSTYPSERIAPASKAAYPGANASGIESTYSQPTSIITPKTAGITSLQSYPIETPAPTRQTGYPTTIIPNETPYPTFTTTTTTGIPGKTRTPTPYTPNGFTPFLPYEDERYNPTPRIPVITIPKDNKLNGGGLPPRKRRRYMELFSFEEGQDTPIPTRFGLGGTTLNYVPGTRGVAKGILNPVDYAPNNIERNIIGGPVSDRLTRQRQSKAPIIRAIMNKGKVRK